MLSALAVVAVFLYAGTARPTLVPGRMQAAVETIYGFIVSMMDETVGPNGRRFVPLIFSLFIFVLSLNILGLIPWLGAFTTTSHVEIGRASSREIVCQSGYIPMVRGTLQNKTS